METKLSTAVPGLASLQSRARLHLTLGHINKLAATTKKHPLSHRYHADHRPGRRLEQA